jgi:hypothetical protein
MVLFMYFFVLKSIRNGGCISLSWMWPEAKESDRSYVVRKSNPGFDEGFSNCVECIRRGNAIDQPG